MHVHAVVSLLIQLLLCRPFGANFGKGEEAKAHLIFIVFLCIYLFSSWGFWRLLSNELKHAISDVVVEILFGLITFLFYFFLREYLIGTKGSGKVLE